MSFQIVHEWNGHLEIFSCSQIIENSRQYLHLPTDISDRKQSPAGAPEVGTSASHNGDRKNSRFLLSKTLQTFSR